MWLVNFLPDWIFYAIFFAGVLGLVASFFMKFIPFVYMYITPIQQCSVFAIGIGTYMAGAIADNDAWLARVKEMEEKVAAAEVKSKEENVKIVTKVVTKTQVIKTRGQDIVKYVDREIVKYDTKFAPGGICEIPKEFIKAHNDAAEAPK